MKIRELEKKLESLPVKKMSGEFRDSLLRRMKAELRPSESPVFLQPRWILALNSAMIILIVILLWLAYLPPATKSFKADSVRPDAAIMEAGKDFYGSRSLSFLANSLKTGGQSLVPLKEVQL